MEPILPELQNLEQQLRSFVPQAPQTSREQLLYQAGWEAALAQQTGTAAASPAASPQKSTRAWSNYSWAAACAVLVLLSTTLGWQLWQQPQPRSLPITITTLPAIPQSSTNPAPVLAIAAPEQYSEESRFAEDQPAKMASYLELRQRVTRGGLSMWPISTPVSVAPSDAAQKPARDWQAEFLREAL